MLDVASILGTISSGSLNQPTITYALNQRNYQQDVGDVVENPVDTDPVESAESGPCATILTKVPTRTLLAMSNPTLSAAILKREIVVLLVTTIAMGEVGTVGASLQRTFLAETVVGEEVVLGFITSRAVGVVETIQATLDVTQHAQT